MSNKEAVLESKQVDLRILNDLIGLFSCGSCELLINKNQNGGGAGDRNPGLPHTVKSMQSGRSTTEPHPLGISPSIKFELL